MSKMKISLNRQQQAAPTGAKIFDWLRIIDQVARRGATESEIEILGEAMLIARKYMENPVEYQKVSTVLYVRGTYTHDRIWPDQIIFGTQRDAEKVRNTLIELAEKYGSVSVAEYCDICAVNPQYIYTDARYGWRAKEIKNSTIRCAFGGYTIDLPKPSKRS